MKTLFVILALFLGFSTCQAETQKLMMAINDEYTVQDTDKWTVSVQRYLILRFADVKVVPKQGKTFSLMLYFKCDTKDLAMVDTPAKMKNVVIASSKKYLEISVEKDLQIEEIHNKGWYGFKTQITDASLVGKKIPEGEFLYLIRGMIRLSEDSALGFSLMINDLNSQETREIVNYIYGFAKERKP